MFMMKCPSTRCKFRALRTGWCNASVEERLKKYCPVNGVSGFKEKQEYPFIIRR